MSTVTPTRSKSYRDLWILLLVFAAIVTGCTQRVGGQDELAAEKAASVVAPVTITLSAPNPLSPIGQVLTGSSSMSVASGADVVAGTVYAGTGGLTTQPDALLNDTWSRGTVALNDRVQIRGTLHAATVTLGSGDIVKARDTSPPFDPPSILSWTVTYPPGTSSDITVNPGPTMKIAPGLYGTLRLNSQGSVTLSTGTYYLTGLDLEAASTVNLDQSHGPVIIYTTQLLILRGKIVPLSGTDPDLMIGYLGAPAIFVESLFDGAIVAPFAQLTLRQVQGTHTGVFYANSINVLDAHTNVQFRAEPSIVKASGASGAVCQQLLGGAVSPALIGNYCSTCASTTDIDHDGTPDCLDGCVYDPNKTAPGLCGCGTPDTDTDGDGVPDCRDQCPHDPNNTSPGQCGCVGQSGLAAAGTPCTDTACPQSGATCNGAGVCGKRAACDPAGSGAASCNCYFANYQETQYWICGEGQAPVCTGAGGSSDGGAGDAGDAGGGQPFPGELTETAAQQACAAKGMSLVRIHTLTENREVTRLVTAPLWLGANDITTPGTWRWSTPTTTNGDIFWQKNGPVGGLFSMWASGAPTNQQCAVLEPGTGYWQDLGCNESMGFVCAFTTPISAIPLLPPPGKHAPPPAAQTACIQSDAGGSLLPSSVDSLQNDRSLAQMGIFQGSAANPPRDGGTCPSDNDTDAAGIGLNPAQGGGCTVVQTSQLGTNCILDTDCPSGFLCRAIQDDSSCVPPDGGVTGPTDADVCHGHTQCVQLNCPPDPRPSCSQIEICDPGTTFDASGPDPGSNLTPQAFNPASLFPENQPITDASTTYIDEPSGSGPEHTWCHLGPQNPSAVQPGQTQPQNAGGTSGGKGIISFGFDPDLEFNVSPNPLALGETNFTLDAKASLTASFALSQFLGLDYQATILDANAELNAGRCNVNDNATHFNVFGIDSIPLDALGIPKFDTAADFPDLTNDCNSALNTYTLAANRMKKAFRDAQQLLSQYYLAKNGGLSLESDLCQQIGVLGATVPFFPGGNECPENEPVETTINRFVDYYQEPGQGQVDQFKEVQQALSSASSALSQVFSAPGNLSSELSQKYSLQFLGIDQEESITIFDTTFFIGPIPMVLQIDAFADYGVTGNFGAELDFPNLATDFQPSAAPPQTLAQITATVLPHASAGISAYVGAGFDFGPIGASVGIEGDLTLAEVAAPVFAGAGLNFQVKADTRVSPADIAPPVSAVAASALGAQLQFGIPKAVEFSIWYNYGLGIDLENVLSGEVDGVLRIDFFFFSRTWRARIVKFNGWSEHFDLVSGGGSAGLTIGPQSVTGTGSPPTEAGTTAVASGTTSAGRADEQVPLTVLAPLPVPTTASTSPITPVDLSQVQSFFYDNQCCVGASSFCTPPGAPLTDPPCCPGFTCNEQPGPLHAFTCVPQCGQPQTKCTTAADCCSPLICGSLSTCQQCIQVDQPCEYNVDCCGNLTGNEFCISGKCEPGIKTP